MDLGLDLGLGMGMGMRMRVGITTRTGRGMRISKATDTDTGTDMEPSVTARARMIEAKARRRLWQLISPTLPVGAYSFSSGMEWAVHAGWLRDREAVLDWTRAQLLEVFARVDLPALQGLYEAFANQDQESVESLNAWLRACRETAELRREDAATAQALARLLDGLGVAAANPWRQRGDATAATLWALAGQHWQIPCADLLEGYLWAWCENQVAAAVKLVPLGQTDGQLLLLALADTIAEAMQNLRDLHADDWGASLPGVSMASMLHETQYSRLFQS